MQNSVKKNSMYPIKHVKTKVQIGVSSNDKYLVYQNKKWKQVPKKCFTTSQKEKINEKTVNKHIARALKIVKDVGRNKNGRLEMLKGKHISNKKVAKLVSGILHSNKTSPEKIKAYTKLLREKKKKKKKAKKDDILKAAKAIADSQGRNSKSRRAFVAKGFTITAKSIATQVSDILFTSRAGETSRTKFISQIMMSADVAAKKPKKTVIVPIHVADDDHKVHPAFAVGDSDDDDDDDYVDVSDDDAPGDDVHRDVSMISIINKVAKIEELLKDQSKYSERIGYLQRDLDASSPLSNKEIAKKAPELYMKYDMVSRESIKRFFNRYEFAFDESKFPPKEKGVFVSVVNEEQESMISIINKVAKIEELFEEKAKYTARIGSLQRDLHATYIVSGFLSNEEIAKEAPKLYMKYDTVSRESIKRFFNKYEFAFDESAFPPKEKGVFVSVVNEEQESWDTFLALAEDVLSGHKELQIIDADLDKALVNDMSPDDYKGTIEDFEEEKIHVLDELYDNVETIRSFFISMDIKVSHKKDIKASTELYITDVNAGQTHKIRKNIDKLIKILQKYKAKPRKAGLFSIVKVDGMAKNPELPLLKSAYGLRTKVNIRVGEEVLRTNPAATTLFDDFKKARDFALNNNIAFDAILSDHQGFSLVDRTIKKDMKTSAGASVWYWMNHSGDGNLEQRVHLDIRKRPVYFYWVASKNIEPGKNLVFDYGDVPEEWTDALV
jgi:hypothetical protein